MNHQDCQCEPLAKSPVGHVTICTACAQVHLTMQYMTVRFELEAFRMLAAMVTEAQKHMDCAAKELKAPALPVLPANLH